LKLDKLIKDRKLVERLDKIDPDNASGSKNDGINYWKGKKIVTLDRWKKIANVKEGFQVSRDCQVAKKEAFQYFPDDYEKSSFPVVVPDELTEVVIKKWQDQYVELMQFRNNSKCGRSLCFNCLLCPDKEESGKYVGISRLVARAIQANNQQVEEEVEDLNSDTSTTIHSMYPCSVLNRFNCPYDRKDEMKRNKPIYQQQERNDDDDEQSNSPDVDYLFLLAAYSFNAESAFIRAREENSIVPIMNVEDVYNALTDRETIDKLLQQALDENRLKYKEEIVEFFMSIKDYTRIEDLTFYKPTAP
jgi:hypothetical protein